MTTDRTFRAVLTFTEITGEEGEQGEVTMARIGQTVTGRNFPEAVHGPFTAWLDETWKKLQENAEYADLPAHPQEGNP